jgi:hypothetical protein
MWISKKDLTDIYWRLNENKEEMIRLRTNHADLCQRYAALLNYLNLRLQYVEAQNIVVPAEKKNG